MVAVWITVLVCLYSWSELSKADDETPTISPTPPTDGNASAVGLLRGMTVAHHSDALSKGRTQEYTKVKGDLLTSSYPREITYGSSDIKNKLAVNIKELRSKEKENNKFAYNILSTDSLRQNKSSLRNTRKLDQKYKPNFVMLNVNQNSLFASNLEPRLPIKNELANSTKFKNELPNINFKNCVNNHLECSENKIILIKHDRLEDKSQENIVDKRKNMLSVLGVMNGKFKNQSKKSENMLDALNESDGLIKSSNLKVIEKTKLRENEINIDNLYGDLKTQLIDIKDEDSYANNYEANEKQRKIFSDSLVDLKDLETDEENRKENDILIRTRRQNNLQFLTDNINNRSKEQHKLCWTETVTVTTNIKTNISGNSHEIIKEYGVVWERPVGEENSSPVSLEKKINDAKETLSRENMNENYLSSNERELLSNSSKKMVKYKIISSNPNQTVEQIETTYCKTGNRIDVETITNNKRKNQRTKFNILPKEKTIIHSNNDSDIFEPSLESQLDLHVKRTRSINLSEVGDTNLKPNKLFEKVRFDYGTFNIPEHSQNQDVAIPNKVREMLGSKSILTQWHPTEKAKTTASYETGEDSSYYDGDHEDYDYYSDYTDYFDESHFNKTMNSKINKVENVSQIKNKKGKISKGSVEDIASIEQSSDEAEEYESGSLKQTENIDHVILESLTSVRPSKNIISNDDNHKHPMVLDVQTSPKNDNAKRMNKTISLESINHKSSQEDYTVKNKTEGIYLETETLTSKIITETYTKIPIVEGISLRSDLATNDSKISPTIKQINLKLKMSTSTPHVTYTEKKPGTTLLDSSKNYDSTINSNEKRSSELTTHSKIPQETSERGNILKNTILPAGRSAYGSTTENTTGQVLIKSTIIFDKVHKISEENSTQQMMELTTEPHTSQIDTDKENTSINIILESAMRSYKTRDSSTKENLSLGSDTHEISNITSKMYIDKAHKIPTKNVTGEEIIKSGLYSNTLNEISLKDNVNEIINIEQITSFYTINDVISTEISTKLLPLNKYTNILNDSSESENVNGLISLESATYLDKSQESLLTENPIEDILESQTTSDILFDTSTKENIFGHISLESDKLTDNSYENMGKSSDVSTSKIKTGNESLGDSSLYLDNDPHFERSDLEKELRTNSTHTLSLESKGIDDTYKITNTSDDSNNEISEVGDFSHSSETNSMGKAADDIILSQDDINDISLSTENNPFDTTSEPDTDTNIYDKETYTEKSSTHIPGYQLISSSDELSYTEKENIHKPGLVEYENNSENIDENYTAEGLDENISLESATHLDKYLDKKEDTTVNASTKSSTVSKLATVHYNLTSLNDSIIIENLGILKLTTDKPISNTSSSFLGSTNLIENTIEPAERSNIDNEMLEFTTLKSLPVELALNGTNDSLFLDSTVMNDKNTEKRIGGMTMENTSNLDKLLKNNEEPFDKNNNTGLLFGLLNDSQDIMKVSTKNNKNESLENAKSTVVVNTENLESKSTTQSKLTGTTQDKLFTYNASLESADLLVTTIKTSIENLSFYSSLDYTTSPGKLVGSGVETLLEDVSMESVARSKTAREPTNKIIEATKMKVMNEELATETSPINTYFKSTRLPTKKAKNKISFDNLNSEFSTLSAQETSPMRNKRPDVKVSFENIALGTSSLSQNKGESKIETSTQNVLRQFSAPLVMNNQSETETSTNKVLSDFTTTLRNNSTPLVEIPTKSELIELDSTSRNTNIETTETFKENVSIKPSTSLENTSLALLETSNSSVPIELLTPSRMTEYSPIEALNINSALELSSPLGNSIIPEVEKSTENISLEFSTLSGETSISLKYAVTESLIVQSDKLLGNNSIPSLNKFTENVRRESSTLLGVIGQLVIETSNENISIESSTLSEKISMAAAETSDGNVLFESTKLSGKTDLKSVEISNSNMSMATFIHSEMTEQSSKELPNTKAIELSIPLGNTIIPPKVEKYSENLSSDHALLSVNTLMPLVDTLSEDISINFATLSGNTIISPIESSTENISNDFITSSEYTSTPPVEISNSNISMESAILLGVTEQSEIYNSNIPFKSSKLLENSIISKGETVTVNVSLESATLSGNITMPSVKSFTETVLIVNSASLGITEQSPINSSIENLLLESFTLSEKSLITDKKSYDENMLLESVTLSGINNKSSLETFSEIISIDFTTLSENTKFASVETSTKEKLTESYTPAEVAVQSAIKTSNANFLLDNFTLSDNSTIHGEETSNGNILLESATSSGITIMPSVEMFAERISTESLPLLGNTNILPRETLIENLSFNSSTISEITNMPQEEIFTAIIANHYTLSDYSSTPLVETPSTNLSIDSPTLSGISGQSAINTSNGYVELEYSKREGISISPVNISKANASFVSSTLSRIATETLEEASNMNISFESTRQSTISMIPSFEKSSSNVYLEYGTLSGMSGDSPVEISTFGLSLGLATHPRTNTNISLEIPIVNISLETSTSFGLFENPPRDLSTQNLSLEFVKPTIKTEQTLLETSTVNLPLENTTLFEVLNKTPKEKSRLNKSLETVTLIGISGEKGIETTFTKPLEFTKILGASTDTSLYNTNASLPLKSKKQLKLNTDILKETTTESVTKESATLLGMTRETLKEKYIPTESLGLVTVMGLTRKPSVEITTGNVSLESATLLGMTREPLKEKFIPSESLELVTITGMTREPSVEITIGNVSLESATLLGMTQEPLKEKSTPTESLELVTEIGTTRVPSVEITTGNVSLESATLLGMTREPLKEKSIPTESLELVTVIGTTRAPSVEITTGNVSLESATLLGMTRVPLKEISIPTESLELVTVIGTTRAPSVEITIGNVSLESATLLGMTREPLKEKSIPTESLELVTVIGTTRAPSVEITTGNVSLVSATLLGMTREPLKEKSIPTESLELVTVIGTTRAPSVEITTGNVSLVSATLLGMTREPLKEKSIPNELLELVTITGMTREPSVEITTGNVSLESATLLGITREPLKEISLIKSVDFHTVSEDVKEPLVHIHSVNEPIENVKILNITREPSVESSSLENEKNSTITKYELNTDTLYKTNEISTVENFSLNVSLESATKYQIVEDSVNDTSTINSLLKSDSLPGKTSVYLEEHSGENVSLVNPTIIETTSVYIKEPFIKNISFESVNQSITTRKPKIKTTDKPVFLEYSPSLVVREKSAIENTTENISFDYAFSPFSIKETEREITSQNVSLNPITLEDRTEISEIKSTSQSVSLEFVPQIASKGVTKIIPTTQQVPLEYVPFKTKSGELQLKPITQLPSLESISSTLTTEESEIKTTTENLPLKLATLSVTTKESNIKHTTQNIPFESSTLSVTRGESKTKPYTQNTLWESSTLAITTDVSEIENTTQNVSLEFVTLAITTEQSEIETTIKYSPLESVPLIVKTGISEIQSTTQDVHLESVPLSIKAEISEIEHATQKSFLKYLPLTFTPRISETEHTAQYESMKSLPIAYTTEISEIQLTTETVSLESVTSEITTQETEIETTNQDAPLESIPLIVNTGISEIQSTTKELYLESSTLLDKAEISEIEPSTQRSLSLTFTPRVSETEHTAQNESLKSLPITYTTEMLEIEPTTRTVPLEAVTFSATADYSEIEITTETVYLESITLAITTEESEIETTNKDSTLESVPLIVKTGISEMQSTTQDVQLESTTLSDKADISEIEPTNQKSFLKNVTLTPIVSVTEHTAKNESLKSLPITYTTEILKLEPTTQIVPLELVTLTATTDFSEIELTTETVSLESVPLIAMTGTSELEPTTQSVTLEPLALTSMTVFLKGEQNILAVSKESDPLTVMTEVSKIESISTNVSLESVSLNAITGVSEIDQATQDESLESFPLSVNTGISAIEPTTQDASWESSTLMETTKESEIETTNQNLSFESDNLPVMTKESDIQPGTQNVDFDSSTLSFKTAESEIKSNTQNIYLESVSLSATTRESEIKPLSKNVSIESVNLTQPTGESLVNSYTQNVYNDAATLSLPTLGSLTEYSTEKLHFGAINLPQIKENVSLEISPLIKNSKYDNQIKMTAMSAQEISPLNVLLEYNNIKNKTKESSLKSSTKNIYLESLNSSKKTKDLGIETSFDNVDLLSENQTEIVEESSVGNYLTSIGLEYASIYGNTGVEISTVNESLENNNLTVDWSLETSSFSVEALTGESTLETSTSNVLWDSSTLSRTGDLSVETTILNRALESTTINWKTYSSTGSFNTGKSLETTTLMDIAGEPAVDTSIKNDSSEYATITQIKEASTVETHSSSDVYWDSTTFQSMTEYSTVDLSSQNVTLESATLSAITSVALELESKVTKNNSLSSNNNSTLNWDLVSETSTKYFTSDNSTSLEINGSVMKENIPKNLYLQSKTNSELTEEVFTDSAMLDFTNLLLSPEKTKFGYTKENYTSRYSTFSQSNNQTTTKHDIVRSKNVHTVTTAKPVLDRVSESFTYPTVNVQEVSKFESLGLVTITPIHSKGNTTRIPLFNQVLLLNISNDQKIYMKEPTSDQLSLESEAIFVSKIENITHIDKVTRPTLVYGKLILPETILEPITLIEPVTFKNSNIQDISKITQTVKSKFKKGYIGSAIFTTSSNHETSPVESIFDRKSLVSANNSSNSDLKSFLEEPLKDKIGQTKYKDYPKLNNFNVNLFHDDSFRNKNNIGEYYQKPINFTKEIKVEKQKEIPEEINSISTFDQYLEHSNHTFSTNKTTSVESLSELIHDGSINLPPKLQDYTAIQPFSEPLYSAFDNSYIPKITKKHKNKLIFVSQNLSREADDYNKNQLIDHEINLNYTITGENISDSHVKQSLFDQIMSKWENAQSKEVLKGVSYLDTNKPHVTVSEANNNIITNKSSINKTQNIEINIMPRSRHKEVESEDKNEITKLPELIFGLPTIDIDPIYKNTLYGENKYKTFYVPTVKENYTLLLENTSQTFNSVNNLNSSLLDQNFQTDNVMSIYGSTKPISDEVTYTDSREDYFTMTEFAIDYMSSTESNEASDEFYDSTTEDVSYGYISSEEFTTTEISTHDPESTEINFDESISEESTKNYFTTTEYSTESEEDTNEIANHRMIGSRYFQHFYNLSSFLSTTILENSTRNENIDEINTKEDERKSDEKDNTEITITELYNRNYEELGTEEIVTTNTGQMGENINQVDLNDNSEWTTTLDSVWNIWTKEPITIKTRPSDDIIPDVEINHPKDNIEKSQSIEMTTLEIIPAKRKFGEKNIISRISLNNDVNNNKMHKEYNGSSEQSSEEEPSIESLKNLETGVYEPNIEIGSLKLYLSSSEKYSDTNKDENLVGMEKQMNDFKKPKDKSILIENKYETKPSTLKYSEERIIKGGKIQSDVPENLPLAPYLHFNKTTKEISNISQFNKKTSGLNHLDFTIEPVERSRLIKLESRLSDYTEPLQTTEAISNKKLSDFGEFRGLHSTNIYPIHRSKSSPIFPSTELEYGLITEKKTDSKYPYLNIYTTPYFSITENIASNLNPSVSFISTQNNKTTKSINHNILNEHKAHIYQNIPRSLQTEYVNREMNNYESTPMTKLYNTGENKMYSTKETLENIERENYSKNRPGFLPKESIVLSPNNSEQISILLPNKYKVDSNISSYSRDEYENKTIPVSTTFYGSGEVNANIPCTDAQNIHHNIESPTIGTRNAGFNLKLNEIERNTLQERKYTAEGQLETLNSKTNLTLQQLMQIFHSKPDIDKEILRHNNLTNNLTVKQILNILYSKVKETAQNQQKYIENKTKEGAPMFDHSSISKARSEISIKQTMQGSKNQFVEIYKDTPRKKKPITELVNCIEKGKNDFEFDYSFDQYDDSSSDKSNQNNREEQIERDILCQVPPEDLNKFERDNEHLKKTSDNTGDDIDISQFYDDDRELSYDSEYGIYDDESHKEDYRRMADISNIEGYQIGNQKNMNDYPIIMSNRIRMPKPFDTNLGQILENNEHNIGNIDYVSDPTIFYYHTTYKDKNQRFTPYDYARYFEVGPQKYTHGKSSNARYNRYENRGINNINAPNNFHSNLEKHFSREKYRNNLLRRRPIRRKYQTTFSKINMLSQNMKYAPSEEYTKILPRVTLTKLKRRNPTFIRIPYLLLRNEYLRDTAKSPTHRNNNYYMNTNQSSEKLRNNGTINFHKNSRILKNRRKIKRKQINGDYSADNVLNLESSILFYPNSETENNSFEYNGLNIGNTQPTYDNEYLEETHNLKQSVLPYINKELESKSIHHGEPFSEIENIDYGKNINNQINKLENVSNYFRNRIEGKPTPSEQPNIAKRQNDDHAELLYERLSSLNPQYSDEVNPNKYSYPDKQSILNHPDTPYTKPNLEMVAYVDYENARTIPHTKFDLSNEKSTHLVKVMKPFSKEEESNKFYETQKPIKGKYPQFNSMVNSKETVLENINNPYSKVTKHEPFENHDSSIENINGKNYTRMLKRVMLPSAQVVINNEYSEYEEPPEETFY